MTLGTWLFLFIINTIIGTAILIPTAQYFNLGTGGASFLCAIGIQVILWTVECYMLGVYK